MSEKIIHRDIDLSVLIKAVCERPQMYAGSGENFREIAAFIDGFAHASDIFSDEIREFSFWLGTKWNLHRNVVWFCNLEKRYSSYQVKLEILPELFEEFRQAKENGWNFDLEYSKEIERIWIEGEKHP